MSQRTDKVESLIHQIVAKGLLESLGGDSARLTVTRVVVSPDLRQATAWLGILGSPDEMQELFDRALLERPVLQRQVAVGLTTRNTPRLSLRQDTGGKHAAEIEVLLSQL